MGIGPFVSRSNGLEAGEDTVGSEVVSLDAIDGANFKY
uniref:Uncharacterized protein n=1 Tax=Lepeophtheirus salmonis TaxID=72036 RepID=A0A0K2V136_LEPSM